MRGGNIHAPRSLWYRAVHFRDIRFPYAGVMMQIRDASGRQPGPVMSLGIKMRVPAFKKKFVCNIYVGEPQRGWKSSTKSR